MIDIHVDTTALARGTAAVAAGLEHAARTVPMIQAETTAGRVRGRVPVRTGRLQATVTAVRIGDGAAVTYGGGLPYARYIEGRSHAFADGTADAAGQYAAAMSAAASHAIETA